MPRAAAKERARGGERGKGRETFRRRRAATRTSSAASKPRCPDVKKPRTGCAARDGRSRERFRARPYGQTVSSRDGSSRIRLIGRGSPARLHLRRRAALKFSLGTRPRSLSSPAFRPHKRPRGSVAATSAADAPGTRARSDARARSLDEGPRRRSRVALREKARDRPRARARRVRVFFSRQRAGAVRARSRRRLRSRGGGRGSLGRARSRRRGRTPRARSREVGVVAAPKRRSTARGARSLSARAQPLGGLPDW